MLTLSLNEDNRTTARMTFASEKLGRLERLNPAVIDITRRFAPERRCVEKFICAAYADAYDARIEVAYPTLMSVRDGQGQLLAAAGFRYAAEEALFLEQYTRAPIEKKLGQVYETKLSRGRIAEVGNLVSSGQGASIFLYAALAAYLDSKNIRYAVATGTGELHRQFLRLGLVPRHVCNADEDALQEPRAASWGRYYEAQPRVLCGSIEEGMHRLREKLGAEYSAYRLHSRLHYGCHDA